MAVKITEIKLKATRALEEEISKEALRTIKEDLSKGIDGTGKRHPGRDFRETGELLDTARVEQGRIVFRAKHAKAINKETPIDRIAPGSQSRFEKRIDASVKQGIFKERG